MKRLILAVMVAAAMAFAPKAEAAIIIDFGQTLPGGTVTDLGGGNWAGSGIIVNAMNAINTPLNAGNYVTAGTAGGFASLDFNTLANTITVTGYIPGLGMTSSVTLLSGSFFGFTVTPFSGGIVFTATGPDAKDRTLLALLGLPANTPFEFFGFSLSFAGATPGTYTAFSTDLANTAVPEPGSLVLLGTGLLGLATIARRRLRKS